MKQYADMIKMLAHKNYNRKTAAFTFKPDFIAQSVQAIDYNFLKNLGITTCLIDLDGTVVDRGKFDIDPDLSAKLKTCGLNVVIATNRPRSRSLKELKQQLHATVVIHPSGLYGKPSKRYMSHALAELGVDRTQVVMIGDRLLQDILGANRSGIYSLMVKRVGRSISLLDKIMSRIENRAISKFTNHYKKV